MNRLRKNHRRRTLATIIIMFLLPAASLCRAQSNTQADAPETKDLPVFELGFMIPMIKTSAKVEPGFGARAVFNPHPLFSIEIEADHIFAEDRENVRKHPNIGDINEVFAGVKSGYRFDRVGLFAKARPGYLSFSRFVPDHRTPLRPRRAAFDLGLVAEFYMTRHWAVRVDAGDTMVFYNAARLTRDIRQDVTHHNLQLFAAIQSRF